MLTPGGQGGGGGGGGEGGGTLPENSPQRRIEPTRLHPAEQRAQHTATELFWPPHITTGAKDTKATIPWKEPQKLATSTGPDRLVGLVVKASASGAGRLIGLVVKASASRAEDPGFESRLRRDFFRVESYQ